MKINYRPEIDGLRAIAVVAVIIYHAQINFFGNNIFTGGFIGVDIFFVISGYLITSIIYKELVTTGNFSFKYFYERRIRRLIPTLLLVLFFMVPLAWIYLIPESFIDFSKSVLYSLGFTSNFYFWFTGEAYGAESSLLKPFLHTWSLAVEEQFYILFPVILFFIYRYFKDYIAHIFLIVLLLSLVGADWGSRNHPSLNFYILPTRAWELLAGSVLAYFEISFGHRSKNKKLNLILPIIGIILVLYSFIFFNEETFHPSIYTVTPIIGVMMIIWFSEKNYILTKLLSSKLFVGIGLISYSLYLWHYPLFAFGRISEFIQNDNFNKFLLLILVILLSIFSYFFVEKPCRNRKIKFKFILPGILISCFLIITLSLYQLHLIPKLYVDGSNLKFYYKNHKKHCVENFRFDEMVSLKCKLKGSSSKKVFIIGDSHMEAIMYDLKDKIISKKNQFITYTNAECLYFPEFNLVNLRSNKISKICNEKYYSKIESLLEKEKNAIIIIGGRFPFFLNNSYFDNQEGGTDGQEWDSKYISNGVYDTIQNSFKNSVIKLSQNNQIILVYPIPETGWNIPQKIVNLTPKKISLVKEFLIPENYVTTSYNVFKERTFSSFELLDSIKSDNIFRVYPHKLFCDKTIKNRCITHDDKNIFYIDSNHPSLSGAKLINNLIIKKIEEIETK